ncbi:hypothetical protein HK096_010170, partial [Nowakowskiella sp. JEL0078]
KSNFEGSSDHSKVTEHMEFLNGNTNDDEDFEADPIFEELEDFAQYFPQFFLKVPLRVLKCSKLQENLLTLVGQE